MNYKRIAYYAMVTMLIIGTIKFVIANPAPPDTISVDSSTRHIKTTAGYPIPAQAGNVTALNFSDIRVTEFWQGYYGNITGRIVLDDGDNQTMFAWELVTPQGEIFATNNSGTVIWDNVTCVNFSTTIGPGTAHKINLSTLIKQYHMNTSLHLGENVSADAFNSTFNTTFMNVFDIGARIIGDDNSDVEHCHQAYTFVDNEWQSTYFREVIMFDNDSSLIFTALLEDSANGFKDGAEDFNDFQMLVAEDGTPGYEAASTYYFYVELE